MPTEFVRGDTRRIVPRFERFDAGESARSWNWPAFFATGPWMLYRKMWGPGLAYLLAAPFVAAILVGVAAAALGVVGRFAMLALTAIFLWIVAPMYANHLYWRHAKREMRTISSKLVGGDRLRVIEKRGGTIFGVRS